MARDFSREAGYHLRRKPERSRPHGHRVRPFGVKHSDERHGHRITQLRVSVAGLLEENERATAIGHKEERVSKDAAAASNMTCP